MQSIKQVLMERDDMSETDAEELISEAKDHLEEYMINDEMDYAYDICSDYFGLEPDYLDELMY